MIVEEQILNVGIREENIAEARREMWGNFPRDTDCQRG